MNRNAPCSEINSDSNSLIMENVKWRMDNFKTLSILHYAFSIINYPFSII
jgi:hypothetical protein